MQGYGFVSGSSGQLEDWTTTPSNAFGDYSMVHKLLQYNLHFPLAFLIQNALHTTNLGACWGKLEALTKISGLTCVTSSLSVWLELRRGL